MSDTRGFNGQGAYTNEREARGTVADAIEGRRRLNEQVAARAKRDGDAYLAEIRARLEREAAAAFVGPMKGE